MELISTGDIFDVDDEVFDVDGRTVYYTRVESNDDKKHNTKCIFRTDDGSIILKKFSMMTSSTRTVLALFNGKLLNLNSIFLFLKCAPRMQGKIHEKGTITSVRWEMNNKGNSMGFFRHSVGLYISTGISRVSAKLTQKSKLTGNEYEDSHKIQMTGVKDIKHGEDIAKMICEHVNEARRTYDDIRKNKTLFKESADWLIQNSVGKIEITETLDMTQPLSDVFKKIIEIKRYKVKWPKIRDTPEKYQHFVIILFNICNDVRYHDQLEKRIDEILKAPAPCEKNLYIKAMKRVMVNLNYEIGTKIDQDDLAEHFNNEGFNSNFFNELVKYIQVKMQSEDDEDEDEVVRRESGMENTFLINKTGSIRHSAPGGPIMEQNYIILMLSIIKYFINRDEIDTIFPLIDEI